MQKAKIAKVLKDIVNVLIIFAILSFAGWICSETDLMGEHPPVTTSFIYQVQVFDANGTPVPDQKVYFLSCLQESAGWTTPTSFMNNFSVYGFTDDRGNVELASINYTLTKNDIVWLGASTNESLLLADYANKTFKPGSIGEWTPIGYSNISSPLERGDKWARMVIVRNDDGKMIDINQYYVEHGLYDLSINPQPPKYPDDYLRFMDNQSILLFETSGNAPIR